MMFTYCIINECIYTQRYSSIIIFSVVLATIHIFINVGATHATPLPKNATVPALFVFGDSIVDPGNNNYLATIGKCNFPPYGRDFEGGVATGRYSNGRIPSDMLAEALGVKKNLPAYLNPNLELEDLLTGASFASGASGYDPLSAKTASVLTLDDQLNLFKKYIRRIQEAAGQERATTIVSESAYIVCTGSNDIVNTYYTLPVRKAQYDLSSYTDFLTKSASNFLLELYELGARRILIVSLPPIGCVPAQRTLRGGLDRRCFDLGNEAAIFLNSKLSSEMNNLNKQLRDAKFIYVDIYYPLLDIIQNPSNYGFEVNTKGCCGTGYIETSFLCTRLDDHKTCTDDTKYVFWDGFHPTERTYQIIITSIYNKYYNKFF